MTSGWLMPAAGPAAENVGVYVLRACIGRMKGSWPAPLPSGRRAPACELTGGWALVPLRKQLVAEEWPMVDPDEQPDDHGQDWSPILEWCRASSQTAVAAYVDIDMWGGTGPRAAAAYVGGQEVMALRALSEDDEEPDPVAEALRAVGVVRDPAAFDEFETLDLGRHRTTGDWLDERDSA